MKFRINSLLIKKMHYDDHRRPWMLPGQRRWDLHHISLGHWVGREKIDRQWQLRFWNLQCQHSHRWPGAVLFRNFNLVLWKQVWMVPLSTRNRFNFVSTPNLNIMALNDLTLLNDIRTFFSPYLTSLFRSDKRIQGNVN